MDAISQSLTLPTLQQLLPELRARVRLEPRAVISTGQLAYCISGDPFVTTMLLGRPGAGRFTASLQRFLHSPRARGWRRGLIPLTGYYTLEAEGRRQRRIHVRPPGDGPILAAAAFRTLELDGRGCYDVAFLLTRDGKPVRIEDPWRWMGGQHSSTAVPAMAGSASSTLAIVPRWEG
ncbi:MAG: hypothetical protein P1V51_16935 [Deltaproteobacteria bacterium]|nr:hypothetical protein [Deltaproteobacteria bacterium]